MSVQNEASFTPSEVVTPSVTDTLSALELLGIDDELYTQMQYAGGQAILGYESFESYYEQNRDLTGHGHIWPEEDARACYDRELDYARGQADEAIGAALEIYTKAILTAIKVKWITGIDASSDCEVGQ